MAGSHLSVAVTGPSGCAANGPFSFVGVPGVGDFAGGGTDNNGFAGTVAGQSNEACDGWSGIAAGIGNTVGGDGSSQTSEIVAGFSNAMEGASESFMGAGIQNTIGLAPPYNTEFASAIVGGSQNTLDSPQSFIGAGWSNSISAVSSETHGQSAFIGAGINNAVAGTFAGIVAGQSNSVAADNATILGGQGNSVSGQWATIVGGQSNTLAAGGQWAAIVGGANNNVASFYSFIGGGELNNIPGGQTNGGNFSVISGGYGNAIPPNAPNSGEYAAIGGGFTNTVTGEYASIAGGNNNTVSGTSAEIGGGSTNSASGAYSTIPGGNGNLASGTDAAIAGGNGNVAGGLHAAIPGGTHNVAGGANSFAAGTSSNAANTGTFVWSDDSAHAKVLASTAANQFLARAAGGYFLYSSANLSTGVTLAPGSGSWSSLSDRAVKTAIEGVDDAQILAKVAALPVSEWSYSAQGTGVRHIGPMAQDFRAAFGLGEDDRHITAIDEDGVALAAIKALQTQLAEKVRKLNDLDTKLARLEQRLEAVEENTQATKTHSGS